MANVKAAMEHDLKLLKRLHQRYSVLRVSRERMEILRGF